MIGENRERERERERNEAMERLPSSPPQKKSRTLAEI